MSNRLDMALFARRIAAVVLAAALVAVECAGAQDRELQLNVITGAGATVRAGSMAPVHVLIRNTGPAVTAAVVLLWEDGVQTASGVAEYRIVELPQGSAKRVTLYSEPPPLASAVRVTLRAYESGADPRNGRALAQFSEPIRLLDAAEPLIGIVGRGYGGMPLAVDEDGNEWGQRFHFPAEFLPDHAAGWEMCDAIVLAPPEGRVPSSAELHALREYVLLGGDLVVQASEPHAVFERAPFSGLMPYLPSGQEQTEIPAWGGPVVHSVGRVQAGEILIQEAGVPLVIRRPYGLGSVTALAYDPHSAGRRPAGSEALWRDILPEIYEMPSEDRLQYATGADDAFVRQIRDAVTRTPNVRIQLLVVVLLIGLYAFASGPGDYLLARRLKRPMLTWVTFPSMVLVFTSAAFLGAHAWVGGGQEIHAHRSVTWFPEGAVRNEAIGFFAPSTATYALGSPGGVPLRPVEQSLTSPDATLIDNERGERRQRIPTWSARVFTRTSIEDGASPPVSFETEWTGGGYRLRMENRGTTAVRPISVYVDGKCFAVDSTAEILAPGERVEVNLPFGQARGARPEGVDPAEIWYESQTRAPRFRAFDHRPLLRRRDRMLSYAVVKPEASVLSIDGRGVPADTTAEVHHVVLPRGGLDETDGEAGAQ